MPRSSRQNAGGQAGTVNFGMPEAVTSSGGEHPFAPQLLELRLRPPQPLLELVRRDDLMERLTAARAPLIVVSAAGGYGKTVTLSQWLENDRRPFAWLQADEADNDPLAFLHYLSAALGSAIDVDPRLPGWLQLAPPPVETRILPALAAAIQSAPPFIFVIDDAHLLTNKACWQAIGLLLEQLPPDAHLCLSGRASPPLPLPRLRAAGRLLELGPAQLSLNPAEIHRLLDLYDAPADAETVAYLGRVTEGWAAGIYLAALAGARSETREWLGGIRGHQRDIAGYLASEVLERQPKEIRHFLEETSILERLSPSLCQAVTGDARAGERLVALAHNNLFISALDDVDEWFRYHQLFAEFLQAKLRRLGEKRVADLHRRAAAWFEEGDQLEEAVRHWLAAGDVGAAGNIVCRAHMHYTHLARYETLHRWLEMFTDEQILSNAALTVAAGWIGPMTGDSPRGRAWISAACRAEVGEERWPGAAVPVAAMQALLRAAFAPGVSQMRRDAELAASLSENAPRAEHAAVAAVLGQARWLAGDTKAALPMLHEAQQAGAVANVLAQMNAIGIETLVLADEGRWSEARTRIDIGTRCIDDAGLPLGLPTFSFLVAHARVQAHAGDPAWVERAGTIDEIERQGDVPPYLALLSGVLLGEVFLERGELTEATRRMHSGLTRLAAMPDAGILEARLMRLQEQLERRLLVEPLTPAERRILEMLPTELSYKEIASSLWVSRHTVHTHVRDIYRKLDVHSRSEAVARARELALLSVSR